MATPQEQARFICDDWQDGTAVAVLNAEEGGGVAEDGSAVEDGCSVSMRDERQGRPDIVVFVPLKFLRAEVGGAIQGWPRAAAAAARAPRAGVDPLFTGCVAGAGERPHVAALVKREPMLLFAHPLFSSLPRGQGAPPQALEDGRPVGPRRSKRVLLEACTCRECVLGHTCLYKI